MAHLQERANQHQQTQQRQPPRSRLLTVVNWAQPLKTVRESIFVFLVLKNRPRAFSFWCSGSFCKKKRIRPESIETTYLAGGCYWGLEDLIRKIPGVINTEVGFSGGHIKNVSYKEVTRGDTGHAETIKIEFDNNELSFKELLFNFFKMHDPTTLNQQGNDSGTQYRSAIFYTNDEQKIISGQVIDLIDKSLLWEKPIVTEISAFSNFYPAEESHQAYLIKNPEGYSCHFIRDFDFTK